MWKFLEKKNDIKTWWWDFLGTLNSKVQSNERLDCKFSTEIFSRFFPNVTLVITVWPDWTSYWTLGSFLMPVATINFPKSPSFLGTFGKGVKIYHFWATFKDHCRFFSAHTARQSFDLMKDFKPLPTYLPKLNTWQPIEPGANVIKIVIHIMQCCNKPLWLVRIRRWTWNSQSECFISAKHSYATLKPVYDICSR